MLHNHEHFYRSLPATPSPKVTDKYMFLDTKRIIADMADLGYEVADARFPAHRTPSGAFGLHEVDFRRPSDIKRPPELAPRILFLNSYDGSRRAQFISGLFRLVCLNGLVAGETMDNEKFLHLGDHQEALYEHIKELGSNMDKIFGRVEDYRQIRPDRDQLIELAAKAVELRFPEEDTRPEIDPASLLMPRRVEDTEKDLFTQFNVVQENIVDGGVPSRSQSGQVRRLPAVVNIERSNRLNRGLWDAMEQIAQAA